MDTTRRTGNRSAFSAIEERALRRRGCTDGVAAPDGEPSIPAISRNSARALPITSSNLIVLLRNRSSRRLGRTGSRSLRLGPARLPQSLAGAGKCISLGVNQALDFQSQFHVALAVESLSGSAFVWFELRELRLPKTQNVGLNLADPGHIANLEIEAVGYSRGFNGALRGRMRCHKQIQKIRRSRRITLRKRSIGHLLHLK